MIHKTRAVVIRTTPYSDSSLIIKAYTELFGMQTYIVNGVRSTRSKGKAGMYRQGTLLNMVVYHKESGDIFRIKESSIAKVYQSIPFSVVKGAVFLYCIELINKAIKEEEASEQLFNFIFDSLIKLDETTKNINNIHILFSLSLTHHLGFAPDNGIGKYFDMIDGRFCDVIPSHTYYIDYPLSELWRKLLNQKIDSGSNVELTKQQRKSLLHYVIEFYRLHIDSFGLMKSPEILETVFS